MGDRRNKLEKLKLVKDLHDMKMDGLEARRKKFSDELQNHVDNLKKEYLKCLEELKKKNGMS
jgi:hypothetical protein